MSDRGTIDLLAAVPLLEGSEEAELAELAGVVRRRTADAGEILWRQDDAARELAFIVEGDVSASLRVAADREVEIGSAGPGDVVGEIALLDGGAHTMTVRATQALTVLALGRADFEALLARRDPMAFRLKRRLASRCAARLRNQLRHLADSLEGGPTAPPEEDASRLLDELEYCGPPDSTYLRRLAAFHDFDGVALWGFVTSGTFARCPAGRTLLVEGAPSPACFLTINGAVEKVLACGDRRIRVDLAGPGKAFGYEGLVDGRPSPVTMTARERSLLLVLPPGPFGELFGREDAISRVFLDVILRDLVATLRRTLRPHARLAASL
jgi:CRP-like cAMP-binding protein